MSGENSYELAAASLMLAAGVTVRKYRTSTTGRAYSDRTIATPRPRGPVSFGTLAHEVGHVVLNHHERREPRWVEEVEAWEFALDALDKFNLKGHERLHADAVQSIAYAFVKALRRGVRAQTISDRYPVWWNAVQKRGEEVLA